MYLITSGTGKTGRRIVTRLRARELHVRVGSRTARPAFDWERPATWPAALHGVEAVYVAYQPDLSAPGATAAMRAFVAAATDAGVRHLVLLRGRNDATAEPAVRLVHESGLGHTILHAAWFAQNLDEDFMAEPVTAGELALPVDGTREPFVDAEDIADVAVAALTDPARHAGRDYELTGPRLLSFAEAVAEVAAAAGRPVRYTPIGLEDLRAGMAADGVPPHLVDLYARLFGELFDGRNAHLGDGVQRALGRPPRDFADYARAAAAAGAWRAVAPAT